MPTFRLTQKLQKELGLRPAELSTVDEVSEPFAEWYAHLFFIDRRKQVIFVEHQTLFSFTYEDVSRKDLRGRWAELFEKGLGKALYVEGASGEVVKAVLDACRGEVRFAKTVDRRTIGAMNGFVSHQKDVYDYHGWPAIERDRAARYMPARGFPGNKKHDFAMDVFVRTVWDRFKLRFEPTGYRL